MKFKHLTISDIDAGLEINMRAIEHLYLNRIMLHGQKNTYIVSLEVLPAVRDDEGYSLLVSPKFTALQPRKLNVFKLSVDIKEK